MTPGKSFYDRQGFFNLCLLGQRPTPGLPRRLGVAADRGSGAAGYRRDPGVGGQVCCVFEVFPDDFGQDAGAVSHTGVV